MLFLCCFCAKNDEFGRYFYEPRPADQCAVVSDLALNRLKAMMGLSATDTVETKEKESADTASQKAAKALWKGSVFNGRILISY